jgi:anti-anti-sigma factor
MDVKLVVQTGEREGQEIFIDDEELVIGRDSTCQFRINHYLVSPRHCRICRDGHRVCVKDLHSATGTKVNDQPIDTTEIRDGDRIKVGSETFLVSIVTDQDGSPGSGRGRPRSVDGGWTKLRVIDNRGIATVYFTDIALINEIEILEVDRELGRLIELGYNRIALNLGNLAHLSSQVIGTMLKVHRRCTADGGMLKICQIHPNVVEIFGLTGLYRTIEIYPTEPMALESDWPEPARRPTPARLKPATPLKTGTGLAHPRRRAGGESRPAASDDLTDLGALATPLTELVAPAEERGASSVRPSPMAQPKPPTNGVGHTHARRGGGGGTRQKPTPAMPDPESAPIPLDDDLAASFPERLDPAPQSSATQAATPTTNGVDRADPRRGIASYPLPSPPAAPNDLPDLTIPLNDDCGSPPVRREAQPPPPATVPVPVAAPASSPARVPQRVRLIVLVGRAQGQAVELSAPRFFIGRDPICHLRAFSPAVLPIHAIIEQRDGRVFLRDGGHAGSLALNDRPLDGAEVEAVNGDILRVGPLQFAFAVAPVTPPAPTVTPTRPDPKALAPPATPLEDPHPHPHLQCPQWGTEGWVSPDQLLPHVLQAVDQLVPDILRAVGRALSSLPAAAFESPRVPPRHASSSKDPVAASSPGQTGVSHGPDAKPSPQPDGAGSPDRPPAVSFPFDLPPDAEPDVPPDGHSTRPLRGPQVPRSLDLDFLCPNCGVAGWLPINRLDRQFQCLACHAKLFTDSSGELRVGDLSQGFRNRTSPAPPKSVPLNTVLKGWKNSLGRPRLPRPCLSDSSDGAGPHRNGSQHRESPTG